jgi:hypothetical protein
VSARLITEELVQQITEDLRARYDLDDEDVRALGERLVRRAKNQAFPERFTAAHRETFERLGQ